MQYERHNHYSVLLHDRAVTWVMMLPMLRCFGFSCFNLFCCYMPLHWGRILRDVHLVLGSFCYVCHMLATKYMHQVLNSLFSSWSLGHSCGWCAQWRTEWCPRMICMWLVTWTQWHINIVFCSHPGEGFGDEICVWYEGRYFAFCMQTENHGFMKEKANGEGMSKTIFQWMVVVLKEKAHIRFINLHSFSNVNIKLSCNQIFGLVEFV